MPNRLARSTSPYLQQHADNPVDWYEWGEEAFAEARRRDVPLLISVGYAACHWCHVMAHESFEDEATARFMDEHFVSVKVDREERPDVDAVYMEATQAMTGHGGWPMTVFATPDGAPFFCGTYFPPQPVQGMPSFPQVLASVAAAWTTRRDEVDGSAESIRAALAERPPTAPLGEDLDPHAAERALATLARSFDTTRGGFGGAPKFPPSMVLEWLLRHSARTAGHGDGADPLELPDALDATATGAPSGDVDPALRMAERTLDAMARGGMYDQLGGGFARYSVDADWVVPHFEKMLYDNALLLRVYVHWWRLTGSPLAQRVVTETADFLVRELRTGEGGFASSLDADSPDAEGRPAEGAFYVWTPDQLREVLGDDDGAWAATTFSVTDDGTFEHGSSVLQLLVDPVEDDQARLADARARLMAAREERARPGRDDKVVAGWNGLAVAALAESAVLLERPDWLDAAVGAADLLVRVHLTGDRLARTSRDGAVGTAPAVLEDYAHVADGFLALHQATGDAAWLARAGALLDAVLARFTDGAGGFYDTADDATDTVLASIRRPRDVGDGPTPAGQSAAAGALLTYAALTGSTDHRAAAEAALREPVAVGARVPRAAGWALATFEALLDGPREVAVVGPVDNPMTVELLRAARRSPAPGAVVVHGEPDTEGVPLLAGRPLLDERPAAYVCRGLVCDRPTSDPSEVAEALRR
ncbi:thioredoxin domain-containing protein [Cellulomonas carbonis]|uniref:Membrane protein n=1 Tax=Cellulomonas carbonis T26 TaxID=947969 RepID=A0A0A0BN09_9CELL|nr:thioredoxin domain-containing protein [Cellulomonas carbonis]KGM09275.1 membrane protein [Cellulomonas carbonis T26]GGC17102.1 thioredoxin domain-containing protein [Cellulomonas carbonis]